MKTLNMVDMFCGSGGSSTGFCQAALAMGLKVNLTAINSWPVAVETHAANHPGAQHICKNVMAVDPLKIGYRKNRLHILVASPECKWHSKARGNKPINDQLRISAWDVVRFTEELLPWVLVVENVQEFADWGPIDKHGRPIKKHRGKIFDSWCNNITALGYTLDKRILCSADYGDPTIRRRLFIIAYKKKRDVINWPVPTYSKDGINGLKRWRSAAEIIDGNIPSRSIFDPERRTLCANTIKRIRAGVVKFYGPYAQPFLEFIDRGMACRESGEVMHIPMPVSSFPEGFIIPQHSWDHYRSAGDPMSTITTTSRGIGYVEPVAIIPNRGERDGQEPRSHDPNDPAPTFTTKKGHGVLQTFCTVQRGTKGNLDSTAQSAADPLSTITAEGRHHGYVQSLMVQFAHGEGYERRVKQVDNPFSTLTTKGEWGYMQPVIVPPEGIHRGNQARSPEDPMQTILASRGGGHVVQGMIMHNNHTGNDEHRIKPVDHSPAPAVTTKRGLGCVEPFLSLYYSSGGQTSDINKPTPTITCEDRISVVEPRVENLCVDILYRMFTNKELSRAMGFPDDYIFKGTSTEQTKQIGNAVTVNKARSIAQAQIAHILDCI